MKLMGAFWEVILLFDYFPSPDNKKNESKFHTCQENRVEEIDERRILDSKCEAHELCSPEDIGRQFLFIRLVIWFLEGEIEGDSIDETHEDDCHQIIACELPEYDCNDRQWEQVFISEREVRLAVFQWYRSDREVAKCHKPGDEYRPAGVIGYLYDCHDGCECSPEEPRVEMRFGISFQNRSHIHGIGENLETASKHW